MALESVVIDINPGKTYSGEIGRESRSQLEHNEPEENLSNSVQNGDLEVQRNVLEPSVSDTEAGKQTFFITDIKVEENITVCRICHLSSERSTDAACSTSDTAASTEELIQLGCACKDELGIAHVHCAETWFKIKGNRLCEICEQTAKNVSGIGDGRIMQGCNNEGRYDHATTSNSSAESEARCWRGPSFYNILLACLVIAFVVPWFFRVNM